MRALLNGAIIGAALALGACATTTLATADAVLRAAGLTKKAYCLLTPEERADFRQRHNLPHVIRCPLDPPTRAEREGNWDTLTGREVHL